MNSLLVNSLQALMGQKEVQYAAHYWSSDVMMTSVGLPQVLGDSAAVQRPRTAWQGAAPPPPLQPQPPGCSSPGSTGTVPPICHISVCMDHFPFPSVKHALVTHWPPTKLFLFPLLRSRKARYPLLHCSCCYKLRRWYKCAGGSLRSRITVTHTIA